MSMDSVNVNNKAVQQNTYDAIVVGSGISGGWAAKELTEKGLKVLMLERGRNIEHIKDYVTAQKDPWDFPHRGKTTIQQQKDFPVIHRGWAAQEAVMHEWTNEKDCPYTEVKPFTWWRAYQMGGRSLMWGRQSYRWSDLDFEANAKDGHGTDWPIRYKDIAPWYDYAEKFAGISLKWFFSNKNYDYLDEFIEQMNYLIKNSPNPEIEFEFTADNNSPNLILKFYDMLKFTENMESYKNVKEKLEEIFKDFIDISSYSISYTNSKK